jgi:hypothetical protein
MAQVTHAITTEIDWLLDALAEEWREALHTAARWDEIDRHDQSVFLAEWGVPRDYLIRLRQYHAHAQMSPEQITRFEDLERCIDEHRLDLERVMGSELVTPAEQD